LHGRFDDPYTTNGVLNGTSKYRINLYIDGDLVSTIVDDATSLFFWDVGTPNALNDHWLMHFGGEIGTDNIITQQMIDGGLGEIYMREMFVMNGVFEPFEILALAASGIRNPTIPGYIAQAPTTLVSVADADLQGYWRFNGFDGGGSGTTDLSIKLNHLVPFAQQRAEAGDNTQGAFFLRAMPGPFSETELGVQCSGFHYASRQVTNAAVNRISPFMVSGVAFDNPKAGFSVGFLLAKKEDVVNNRFDGLLAYGEVAANNVSDATLTPNRGWFIGTDDQENVKMVLSLGGSMFLDNAANASRSGQITCGAHEVNNIQDDDRNFQPFFASEQRVARLDSWTHYTWVFDPSDRDGVVTCYVNGEVVDVRPLPSEPEFWVGPQVPANPAFRYLTFLQHTRATPFNFDTINLNDFDSVMTDTFYFSRSLTQEEVRSIAFNGIEAAQGTEASGAIGGFIAGQDTASGIIGGYTQGQDTASGIIGAFFPAAIRASGTIGGYVSGVVFATGSVGGFVRGQDTASGILGGFIRASDTASGIIAGFVHGLDTASGIIGALIHGGTRASGSIGGMMLGAGLASGSIGGMILGGLEGLVEIDSSYTVKIISAEDFDAQLQLLKTSNTDFDARVVIFQDEVGPLVDIIVPDATVSGLAPPFNQYFVAKASGQQGKSIVKTRWTFGDFTPSIEVAKSGADCYPVQHLYTSSGFYIAKFEAIDSNGQHGSATRIINAASGVDPVIISLSGVPRSGTAALTIDFTTTVDILPTGVILSSKLLDFDDGQSTVSFNPTHVYSEPGIYRPIWCIRDSRGVTWCDSLEAGNDFLENGG
jgi:hypothetical protein